MLPVFRPVDVALAQPNSQSHIDLMSSVFRSLVDAADVLKHVRSPGEGFKALLPGSMLKRRVLNEAADEATSDATVREHADSRNGAEDVAASLRKACSELKMEAISETGEVDYTGLVNSDAYRTVRRLANKLRGADMSALVADAERIAFFTNVYNVLSVHGVLALGIRKSVMEMPTFFKVVSYRLGDYVLSLDEIENGVLRRNAPHPATGLSLFGDNDPRLALMPSVVDPRIHAALVCASTSCPPVAFYDASQLDAQLDAAANNYVTADVEVDDTAKAIRLPITFLYYRQDFGGEAGFPAFLRAHSKAPAQREALERAFEAGYGYEYHRYDWSLNAIG